MLYNVHTHLSDSGADHFSIRNIHENFAQEITGQAVSMGLHPWYLHADNFEQQFEELKGNVIKPEVLAIGECGLDKIAQTDWNLQLMAFQRQIALAGETGKPLIIHCVRAFNEVLSHLKPVKIPVVFHGVNNKRSVIQPVVNAGYYLSFGKALFNHQEQVLETFRKTPLEQVFLETDDLESDISEMYQLAARIRRIPEEELVVQLAKNFSNVFGS